MLLKKRKVGVAKVGSFVRAFSVHEPKYLESVTAKDVLKIFLKYLMREKDINEYCKSDITVISFIEKV